MIKRNVSTPPKENGEYFCYDNYGNKRVVSFKNGGWLTSDRNNIVSWVDETPMPPVPEYEWLEIDYTVLSFEDVIMVIKSLSDYIKALKNWIKNIAT